MRASKSENRNERGRDSTIEKTKGRIHPQA
jgi:hypothetical protein